MSIFKRLDHISIGVQDFDAAKRLFVDVFGGVPLRDVGSNEQEAFSWFNFSLGGKKVELVSPTKAGEGGVGRFLAKRGDGFHHLSISVANLDEAIRYFESHHLRVLAPSKTDPNWKHFYLHPQDTFGALIQVFEENDKTLAGAGE
jgi:methylmalonyl-CoA/ethylmalonyl-CoA epimerase